MDIPQWKKKLYERWFCDPLKITKAQLANKDFADKIDYSPKQIFSWDGTRQFSDFMLGNWAWQQAVSYTAQYQLSAYSVHTYRM